MSPAKPSKGTPSAPSKRAPATPTATTTARARANPGPSSAPATSTPAPRRAATAPSPASREAAQQLPPASVQALAKASQGASSSEEPVLAAADLVRILSDGHRPSPPGPFSSIGTLAWRALLKIKHVPFQLFDVTATPLMFTLLFTFMFGGALAGSPKEYIQFLLPGILVQTVVFITVYSGVGLNTDIQKGLFDRFRSLPMWQPSPIFGALTGDVLRYLFASLVVIAVGFALGFSPDAGPLGIVMALGLILLFAFAVSWMWIIVGMLVKTPETVMTMSFLILFPLTFVSNVFVQPETMPKWLQAVVAANPVTHLVDAARGLIHGGADGWDVMMVLIASAAIIAIFAPLALVMYHRER